MNDVHDLLRESRGVVRGIALRTLYRVGPELRFAELLSSPHIAVFAEVSQTFSIPVVINVRGPTE